MRTETYTIIRNAFARAIPAEQTRQQAQECYSPAVRDEILELCKTKKYTPVVADYLIRLGLEAELWQEKYDFFLQRNRSILAFVAELFAAFECEGIRTPFVYENFGALLESGTDLALYASGDVDLCADISEYEAIARVMQGFGFVEVQGKTKFFNLFRTGFAGKIGDMDYRINVMFKPLVRYKLPICIDERLLHDAGNFLRYADTKIRIPTGTLLLYLNLLRISVHGYVRSPDIRLYVDVYNGTINAPDWQQILRWARQDGTENRVAVAAGIAHDMLGTPVYDEVLGLLAGRKKAAKLLDAVYDSEKKMLRLHQSKLERFCTEFYSDNRGLLSGMLSMLFPNRTWLQEYYAVGKESLCKSYLRYLNYLVKGKI